MVVPTNKSQTLNKLPKMTGDTGYSLGFFCGCLVGAVGTYLAFTDDGKILKQKIIKEFRSNQQALTLEAVLSTEKSVKDSAALNSVKDILATIRRKINPSQNLKPIPKTTMKESSLKRKHYFKKK